MTMGGKEEESGDKLTEDVAGSDDDAIQADSDDSILAPTEMTNFSYNLSRNSLTSTKQQARQLVINVCNYFKKEKANKGPLMPTDCVLKRTSAALKLKDCIVVRLMRPSVSAIPRQSELSTRLHPLRIDAIKNFIQLYYKTDPTASMMKAYQKIVKNGLFVGSHTSFRRMLYRAGFQLHRGRKKSDAFLRIKPPFIFENFLHDLPGEPKASEGLNSADEDIKFEPMEGLECEKEDLRFFQSLLPAVSKLSDQEKMKFRLAVMNKVHSLLYESWT